MRRRKATRSAPREIKRSSASSKSATARRIRSIIAEHTLHCESRTTVLGRCYDSTSTRHRPSNRRRAPGLRRGRRRRSGRTFVSWRRRGRYIAARPAAGSRRAHNVPGDSIVPTACPRTRGSLRDPGPAGASSSSIVGASRGEPPRRGVTGRTAVLADSSKRRGGSPRGGTEITNGRSCDRNPRGDPPETSACGSPRRRKEFLFEYSASPVEREGRLAAVVDVPGRHRQAAGAAEREFVTNAAHELQTPLAAITSAVEVLQAGAKDDDEDRDRFLAHIEHAAGASAAHRALLVLARAQTRRAPSARWSRSSRSRGLAGSPERRRARSITARRRRDREPRAARAGVATWQNAQARRDVVLRRDERGRADRGPTTARDRRSSASGSSSASTAARRRRGFRLGLAIVRGGDGDRRRARFETSPRGRRRSRCLRGTSSADAHPCRRGRAGDPRRGRVPLARGVRRRDGRGRRDRARAARGEFDLMILDLMLPAVGDRGPAARRGERAARDRAHREGRGGRPRPRAGDRRRRLRDEAVLDGRARRRVRAILRRRELDRGGPEAGPRSAGSSSTRTATRSSSTAAAPPDAVGVQAARAPRVAAGARVHAPRDHAAPLGQRLRRRPAGVRHPHLEPAAQGRARPARPSAS